MKIPAKFNGIIFAFFMSLFMAFIMSAILTLVNLGPVHDFVSRWLRAFLIAWCCAFPVVLLVAPIARKMVSLVVDSPRA